MDDFWGPLRRRWPAGTPRLHWHVLPGTHPAVAGLAAAYGGLTSRQGLDAVPSRWLHQTLYMVSAAGEPAREQIRQMIHHVRAAARLWTPMSFTYGPAAVSAQAIVLRVSPGEPAAQLHGAVLAAAAVATGGQAPPPPDVPYWGHLTIAYANTALDDAPLLSWLAAHTVAPVTVTVRAVHLVRQTHRGHLFTWEPVATVPLGQPARAPG